MPLPVGEDRIEEAERELGRRLPAALRCRLTRDNGGEIEVDGYPGDSPIWHLHPVWDPSDRRRMARTANHVVRETREAHDAIGDLPAGSFVVAGNGTGVVWWDHETASVVLDSS